MKNYCAICSPLAFIVFTPEFYVGYARWWAASVLERQDMLGITYASDNRALIIYFASSDQILDNRMADKLYFRGLTVRLAKKYR